MLVNGKDDIPYMKWKITFMFETTNQTFIPNQPGWWLTYPSEKYEFVSWDDDIPNFSGKS